MEDLVKIVIYVPIAHAQKIRDMLRDTGAGHTGNYDSCSFSAKGLGRFRPLKGAKPFVGSVGKIEAVEEERIETIITKKDLPRAIAALKKAHPYEEPAIDIYPLLNHEYRD